ncbi:hypothetical protein JQ574_25345 [Bradyrhizobium sp. AUGA SZCCT0158]|uniref:DUF6883 domain-containing protein n=1 Tax=Bradyrhizobium sp. AUGA SZCCT0158 TaxID=2807661 RepID=UPI001BAC57FB|nr:DUF6883 domain-containing protein [Bradyrhizobium sp. AUGA SZCCT0158]MBR1199327.1 hypothetical protein [Bradyrhizobium sp. AUGA SZCCT0158]
MTTLEPLREDGSWLIDAHLLRVETIKVTDYLLCSDHPRGGGKAKFFESVGFSKENVQEFAAALRTHAAKNQIAEVVPHSYGVKTVIDCFMPTPSGKDYCIRSVWNDHGDGAPPKLITAHPL